MARRVAGKAKGQAEAPAWPSRKPPSRKTGASEEAPSASSAAAPLGADGRVAELEAECLRLKAELEEQRERLAKLEAQRRHLVDRIDWAIDSLQSLIEE